MIEHPRAEIEDAISVARQTDAPPFTTCAYADEHDHRDERRERDR